jgi:hypothetical protein
MQRNRVRGCSSTATVACLLLLTACSESSDPSLVGDASGGASARAGSGGHTPVGFGGTGVVNTGGTAGSNQGGGNPGQSCDRCGSGQRCETTADGAKCIDNSCDDLACGSAEECQRAPGGGNLCVDIGCESDVDCPPARFCDGSKCVDDTCESGARRCEGEQVWLCDSSGAGETSPYECAGLGADRYSSECVEQAVSSSGCTCEDDWDCPAFTTCEAGLCSGTGKEPTCTLDATPFEEVLPGLEFRWGGTDSQNPEATGKPFAWSAQVGSTPLVMNLDDDNGDGRINEFDFPEIVFITYSKDRPGIVRAVHGGGPAKGSDFFALCGEPEAPGSGDASYSDASGAYFREGGDVLQDCDDDAATNSPELAIVRAGSILAGGDLDADGVPEIVALTERAGVLILSNRGEVLAKSAVGLWPTEGWSSPAVSIANIDFADRPELIVGNHVLTLSKTGPLTFDKVLTGTARTGTTHLGQVEQFYGPVACIADLYSDPGLEIVAGTSLYGMPERPDDCSGANAQSDYCQGRLLTLWNAADVTANDDRSYYPEGFCAVADVLGRDTAEPPGPENPLDGVPEVMVVADGHVLILQGTDSGEAEGGTILQDLAIPGGGVQGGAPNVDDFDGDGFPEIGTALATRYAVVDLQAPDAESCPAWIEPIAAELPPPGANPVRTPGGRDASGSCSDDADCNAGAVCNVRAGSCVCLHNGWMRETEDDSSRVTSSSVFDFNDDGAAEVIYNDECYFHVYDGLSGATHLQIPSLSRTIMENPVVADVDNDGNAEIVFVQNNENIQCDADRLDSWPDGDADVNTADLPNGLEVWGDPTDTWVSARRIWNQHGYHVTNALENGGIPVHEPESWVALNGRFYNTYRSQPRVFGVAPDLTLTGVQVSSPGSACGSLSDEIEIVVGVRNAGDLRVGPGIEVQLFGSWDGEESPLLDENGDEITVALTVSLEPGDSTLITVKYRVGNNPAPNDERLPETVRAIVDGGNDADGDAARECDEKDNELVKVVESSEQLPDLELEVLDATCGGQFTVNLKNVGSTAAEDVLIRIYAGDPAARGEVIGEETVPGPLAPGDTQEVTIRTGAIPRTISVWGAADPLNAIAECNDANNVDAGPQLPCTILQ